MKTDFKEVFTVFCQSLCLISIVLHVVFGMAHMMWWYALFSPFILFNAGVLIFKLGFNEGTKFVREEKKNVDQ